MESHKPRAAVDLLSFADVGDIDEFVAGLARYERGEMTADEFKVFRLGRGTYGQRQADVNMLRVKIPQGLLAPAQLERLADIADDFSRGFCHVTTRQNIQFHFVKLAQVPDAMRLLAEVGLTTKEACGHTVRNITACPLAGTCAGELFDVTPYARAVTRRLLRRPENQALPRKFKISFSGCKDDCALGAINDVGCIARVQDGARGFRVKVAGGLSTTPENAHLLYDFLPADELIPLIEAILAVFNQHGNRQNKARARMKYVVRRLGWDGYRAEVARELDRVRARGGGKRAIDPGPDVAAPPVSPAGPESSPGPAGADLAHLPRFVRTNVSPQKQAGYVTVTVRLLRGDVDAGQLRCLARVARRFGEGTVRTTLDQNLVIRFVRAAEVPALVAELAPFELAAADANTICDVTACPGAETCNLAVTASRELAGALSARLEADGSAAVEAARDLRLKVSGCPNSCGQHHIAGIGFHGGMRRVGGRVVPEYTIHLGGGVDEAGASFGRQLVKVPARRAPEALVRLLELYHQAGRPGERAVEFFRRAAEEEIRGALVGLTLVDEASATGEDFLDLGDDREFQVKTGPGECAA